MKCYNIIKKISLQEEHPMAKMKTVFFCTDCGTETPKWMGRCPGCGAFNTMQEHIEKPTPAGKVRVGAARQPRPIRELDSGDEIRFPPVWGNLTVFSAVALWPALWCW
jgi:DNA repair protein RadA/Sms